jgi:hypothetical protein
MLSRNQAIRKIAFRARKRRYLPRSLFFIALIDAKERIIKTHDNMRSIDQLLFTGAIAVSVFLTVSQATAQDDQDRSSQRQGSEQGARRQRQGSFDRAEYQQRTMDRYREWLEVTDDAEWKAVQLLIQKVLDARTALGAARRGVFVRGGQPGANGNQTDQSRRRTPAAEGLQRAIDAKAPAPEIKAALAKYLEYRKGREVDLEKAQEALRAVLTSRQEAIAVLSGLL